MESLIFTAWTKDGITVSPLMENTDLKMIINSSILFNGANLKAK